MNGLGDIQTWNGVNIALNSPSSIICDVMSAWGRRHPDVAVILTCHLLQCAHCTDTHNLGVIVREDGSKYQHVQNDMVDDVDIFAEYLQRVWWYTD